MSILSSRRFWAFLIAQIITIATLVINHYVADPFAKEMAVYLIGTVQGLAGILIVAYTVDDTRLNTAQVKADASVEIARINSEKC